MSKADQFWRFAEEAMRRADQSGNEKEKLALIDLARTCTQAALASQSHDESAGAEVVDVPPEHRAPAPPPHRR